MFTIKKVGYLFLFIIIANSAFSQVPTNDQISDEELGMFASAVQQIQVLDQQAQQEMVKAIEEEGLNVQKFTAIQKAEGDPQQEPEADEKELEKYNNARQEVVKVQQTVQGQMEKKIKETGLSVERYQVISQKVQQDPELREKVQEKMQPAQE